MSFSQHEGHELRRGPVMDLKGTTAYACLTCHSYGAGSFGQLKSVPHLSEQDYYDNIDWIEGN